QWTERHHVQVFLETLELNGSRIGSVRSPVRRIMGSDLTGFEVEEIESLIGRRLRNIENRQRVFLGKNRLARDCNSTRKRGHRRAEGLRLLQKRIGTIGLIVR